MSHAHGNGGTFNIKQDLEHRPFAQQFDILWSSGPTWHDAAGVAKILKLTPEQVTKLAADLPRLRATYNIKAEKAANRALDRATKVKQFTWTEVLYGCSDCGRMCRASRESLDQSFYADPEAYTERESLAHFDYDIDASIIDCWVPTCHSCEAYPLGENVIEGEHLFSLGQTVELVPFNNGEELLPAEAGVLEGFEGSAGGAAMWIVSVFPWHRLAEDDDTFDDGIREVEEKQLRLMSSIMQGNILRGATSWQVTALVDAKLIKPCDCEDSCGPLSYHPTTSPDSRKNPWPAIDRALKQHRLPPIAQTVTVVGLDAVLPVAKWPALKRGQMIQVKARNNRWVWATYLTDAELPGTTARRVRVKYTNTGKTDDLYLHHDQLRYTDSK